MRCVMEPIAYNDGKRDPRIAIDKLQQYLGVKLSEYLCSHLAYGCERWRTEKYPSDSDNVEGKQHIDDMQ